MTATTLDLRYRTRDLLRAVERGETVTVLYRGKPKARLLPILTDRAAGGVRSDQAFGIWKDRKDLRDVSGWVRKLRRGRFRGL